MRRGVRAAAWTVGLPVLAQSCVPHGARDCEAVVRDSADVAIVENPEPCEGELPRWVLGDVPFFDLGQAEGEPEEQLYRVSDATRTAAGRYVVANGGTHEIREYDESGVLVRSMGGEGDGPGEFRSLDRVAVRGDTVIAHDLDLRRVTGMTWRGEVVSTVTLTEQGVIPVDAVGPLADGSFLLSWMMDDALSALRSGDAHVGEVVRGRALLVRYGPTGRVVDTVGVFPGLEEALGRSNGRPFSTVPAFYHGFSFTPWRDGVAVGDQERYEVQMHALDGTLVRIVRAPTPDLTTTEARLAELLDRLLGEDPDPDLARATIERFQALPRPDLAPAFGRLLADAEGNLWVSEYEFGPVTPRFWEVFDATGVRVARVDVPDRFRVVEVGMDYVLGVWRDELDVEHVRAYALRK